MLSNKLTGATAAIATYEGWNLANVVRDFGGTGVFNVATEEATAQDLFFKSDGTKMYILGSTGDDVNEYNLSTAWDISTSSYVRRFSVALQDGAPTGLFFKSDGTKMYIIGPTNDRVNEYNLSTAWDISTASYLQNFSILAAESTSQGVFFKPDGTKMYVVGISNDRVTEYSLSTAWNISTATLIQHFSVVTQETTANGLFFNPDGTKMYIMGSTGIVSEYSLSTGWDVSTSSSIRNINLNFYEGTTTGIYFKDDGTRMYIVGTANDNVLEFLLSTPWNVSTATIRRPTKNYFYVGSQDAQPSCIYFKPDGTKMYMGGPITDRIYEYNLSTAWNISTASYLQSFYVAGQESTTQGLSFKPDGTMMFIVGSTGDRVYQYSLSTAWNVSTASFVRNISVGLQDSNPTGFYFKPDGTKFYVIGTINDRVSEYNLSTAWDISTASFIQNFSITDRDGSPSDLFFKPDGTKMYFVGILNDRVYEYSLSTAWDISTATFVQDYGVSSEENTPSDLFFKDDGTVMYIVGSQWDAVWAYDL